MAESSRISVRAPSQETSPAQFASDVQYYLGLQPRQLPSRYLYDGLGSALFEAICHLPWYPITRAEFDLLSAHAVEIFDHLAPLSAIVELGGGSGEKLAVLVESAQQVLSDGSRLDLHLVDVSATALEHSARALSALGGMHIITHQTTYEAGLGDVRGERHGSDPALVLFLGSNVGNFDPPGADALLLSIRASLRHGDGLLIGTDLVKPERELVVAYDDPLGVTAAFNLNLLVRINSELGGDFDLSRFTHRAVWNAEASRIEMHLVSLTKQRVRVPAADLEFTMEAGETIWTESSYKYRPADIVAILERAGFRPVDQWVDRRRGFALTLVKT